MPKILSPSDKFQPRGIGDLMHPAKCLACGSGNCMDGYIDLGTYFDYEGQMYLCSPCLQEAGEVLGMLTISESKFLQHTNETLAAEKSRAEEELAYANERLSAFDRALAPVVATFMHAGVLDPSELSESSGNSTDSSDGDFKEPTDGELAFTESSLSEGHTSSPEPERSLGLDI